VWSHRCSTIRAGGSVRRSGTADGSALSKLAAQLPRDLAYDLGAIGRVPMDQRDQCLRGLCMDAWEGRYGVAGQAMLAQLLSMRGASGRRGRRRTHRGAQPVSRDEVLAGVLEGDARTALGELVSTLTRAEWR
jgi:hypothetical protein